jgi:hypothetical protein
MRRFFFTKNDRIERKREEDEGNGTLFTVIFNTLEKKNADAF